MRFLKCTLILLICFALLITAALTVSAGSSYIRGDADGDGQVTILDATAIQRKLAHFSVISFDERAADADGDGVSILDATMIQRYLAKFANVHNIGELVVEGTEPTEKDYELPFVPR